MRSIIYYHFRDKYIIFYIIYIYTHGWVVLKSQIKISLIQEILKIWCEIIILDNYKICEKYL